MRPKSDLEQKNDCLIQALAVFMVVRAVDKDKFLREVDISDIETQLHTTPEQREAAFFFAQKIDRFWLDDSLNKFHEKMREVENDKHTEI